MSTEEPTAHCAQYTEKQGERSRLRTLCRHSQQPPWERVVGGARGWGGSYTYTSTVVCIHCAGGWSLLLTASRTVPPSLSSWGAEHNEKPPTTSTPGSDTSNHCPALKETVGLETFNSNPFTVGESCFTPTTVACDVTYVQKANNTFVDWSRAQCTGRSSLGGVGAAHLGSVRVRRPHQVAAASRPSRHTGDSS